MKIELFVVGSRRRRASQHHRGIDTPTLRCPGSLANIVGLNVFCLPSDEHCAIGPQTPAQLAALPLRGTQNK